MSLSRFLWLFIHSLTLVIERLSEWSSSRGGPLKHCVRFCMASVLRAVFMLRWPYVGGEQNMKGFFMSIYLSLWAWLVVGGKRLSSRCRGLYTPRMVRAILMRRWPFVAGYLNMKVYSCLSLSLWPRVMVEGKRLSLSSSCGGLSTAGCQSCTECGLCLMPCRHLANKSSTEGVYGPPL